MHLALFPLKLVSYPGVRLNLHIFEPRYRQLIRECDSKGNTFGIVSIGKNGKLRVGTEMELLEIPGKYPDGKMDIVCRGIQPFRLISFNEVQQGKLYPSGEVDILEFDLTNFDSNYLESEIKELLKELYSLIGIAEKPPQFESENSICTIANKIGLSINQEMKLLETENENDRREFVYDHLLHVLPILRETESMKAKISMNGHFKKIDPADYNFLKP